MLDGVSFLNENNNLPNLQHIYIYSTGFALQDSENIHYENIEHFTLGSVNMSKYPFSFGNLKHLILTGHIEINDSFCKFIGNIKHLQTLKITSTLFTNPESFSKMLELQNILSNVVEMQLKFNESMSLDQILRYLKQSRKLRKLSFHLDYIAEKRVVRNGSTVLQRYHHIWVLSRIFILWILIHFHFVNFFRSKCYVIERITD